MGPQKAEASSLQADVVIPAPSTDDMVTVQRWHAMATARARHSMGSASVRHRATVGVPPGAACATGWGRVCHRTNPDASAAARRGASAGTRMAAPSEDPADDPSVQQGAREA